MSVLLKSTRQQMISVQRNSSYNVTCCLQIPNDVSAKEFFIYCDLLLASAKMGYEYISATEICQARIVQIMSVLRNSSHKVTCCF